MFEKSRSTSGHTSQPGAGPWPQTSPAELNLDILKPLACYVEEKTGKGEIDRIVRASGLTPGCFAEKAVWGSLESVERFLAEVRELVGSDEEFKAACVYKMKDSYGAMRFVLWALSPSVLFGLSAKTMDLISKISSVEVIESQRAYHKSRYRSKKKESRLLCLSRQAQAAALPTLFGMPPANLKETGCIGLGDDVCEYEFRWYQPSRWWWAIGGLLLGSLAMAVLLWSGSLSSLAWLLLPIVGFAIGLSFESYRTNRINLATSTELTASLHEIASRDSVARQEVVSLNENLRDWNKTMEQRVTQRTDTLEEVILRLQELSQAQKVTLRGFSHDLRNPLSVLSIGVDAMRAYGSPGDKDFESLLEDQEVAVENMRKLLGELMQIAESDNRLVRLSLEEIEVEPLIEKLHKRLSALLHGRDVRCSVITAREAPKKIVMDQLVFDRIVDNILSNAAKYTQRGSIVVEISGTPGFMTIKVSDTGCGIDEEKVREIFRPHSISKKNATSTSFHVGLSVVVQLLAQIGGKLEVMSIPQSGTTFWVHLPVEARDRRPESVIPIMSYSNQGDEVIGKVVTVRKNYAS